MACKRLFLVFTFVLSFILSVVFLGACNNSEPDGQESIYLNYVDWKMSDDATDFNGDRAITEEDYNIYKAYSSWKLSAIARDYDGDTKIDYKDYIFYNNPHNLGYVTWLSSDIVTDYNEDGAITEEDYAYYAARACLIGNFKIENFETNSTERYYVYLLNSGFKIHEIEPYLDDLTFNVNEKLQLSCVFSEELSQRLGADLNTVQNAISSCKLDNYSDTLYVATFNIGTPSLTFNLYLSKTNSGFSTSINVRLDGTSIDVSFDMVYSS